MPTRNAVKVAKPGLATAVRDTVHEHHQAPELTFVGTLIHKMSFQMSACGDGLTMGLTAPPNQGILRQQRIPKPAIEHAMPNCANMLEFGFRAAGSNQADSITQGS